MCSEGFGISTDDPGPDDDVTDKKVQDGTGMGEGAGLNDVSDQIIDEDQLVGVNEKVCCTPRIILQDTLLDNQTSCLMFF